MRIQFWYPLGLGARIATAATPADTIYEHGYVYTIDLAQSVQQAVAVRDGRIIYVGNDTGVQAFIGPQTQIEDLRMTSYPRRRSSAARTTIGCTSPHVPLASNTMCINSDFRLRSIQRPTQAASD